MTVAIADCILHNGDYNNYLRNYIKRYSNYKPDFSPYFSNSFSPSLLRWVDSNKNGTSTGNGAMMRISPVGYLFDTEEDVIKNARLATIPSHNSSIAISSAIKIALIIFYLRMGFSLDEIYNYLNIKVKFTPFTHFNTTCYETIDNCLYVLYNSNSFEESIRNTIALGGDTDTNACIVGSMAEALYGIDEKLVDEANDKLPDDFIKVLSKAR